MKGYLSHNTAIATLFYPTEYRMLGRGITTNHVSGIVSMIMVLRINHRYYSLMTSASNSCMLLTKDQLLRCACLVRKAVVNGTSEEPNRTRGRRMHRIKMSLVGYLFRRRRWSCKHYLQTYPDRDLPRQIFPILHRSSCTDCNSHISYEIYYSGFRFSSSLLEYQNLPLVCF